MLQLLIVTNYVSCCFDTRSRVVTVYHNVVIHLQLLEFSFISKTRPNEKPWNILQQEHARTKVHCVVRGGFHCLAFTLHLSCRALYFCRSNISAFVDFACTFVWFLVPFVDAGDAPLTRPPLFQSLGRFGEFFTVFLVLLRKNLSIFA